jgi:cytochrome c556
MLAIEDQMLPIDTYTVDESVDTAALTANAATIAAMLQATPHLYPPTTNLYDPDTDYPETLALPRIWEDFATFAAMADGSVMAAEALTAARDPDTLRSAAINLRATCDACHALHLRPYVPSQVTEEDLNFDFDSLFDK